MLILYQTQDWGSSDGLTVGKTGFNPSFVPSPGNICEFRSKPRNGRIFSTVCIEKAAISIEIRSVRHKNGGNHRQIKCHKNGGNQVDSV